MIIIYQRLLESLKLREKYKDDLVLPMSGIKSSESLHKTKDLTQNKFLRHLIQHTKRIDLNILTFAM